jgi:HEPN domain-containing protein
MADARIVKEWLQKAAEDYGFAASNLKDGSAYFAQICFHFHQSAEKYLKAYIVARDLEFERTHDLLHLLKSVASKEPSLSALQHACSLLNTAYIDTRYPVHWPTGYDRQHAEQLKNAALLVANAIKRVLENGPTC